MKNYLKLIKTGKKYMTDQKYTNKLISEKSPYLIQHSHNPVGKLYI
jgi:hypothetical protein